MSDPVPELVPDNGTGQVITVNVNSDVLTVEKQLKTLEKKYGLADKNIREMEMVAGELVENILKHHGHGKITLTYHPGSPPYVELLSENEGTLSPQSFKDGVSTKNTAGLGLGVINRLSDAVSYEQNGKVLRIRTVKYTQPFPVRSEIAVLSYPLMLRDHCNGDGYLIHRNHADLFCVIDALGHGEDAHQSTVAVQGVLAQHHSLGLEAMLYEAHKALKDRRLRGAAVSLVKIDYDAKAVLFCGLGDVMVKIFLPHEDKSLYPLPQEGIVGDLWRTLQVQQFPLVPGALIAMFSDGLSGKLSIPKTSRQEHPVHLVNRLMDQFGRAHDDRTLLLAKLL